jgi:hypothetical protein
MQWPIIQIKFQNIIIINGQRTYWFSTIYKVQDTPRLLKKKIFKLAVFKILASKQWGVY